MTRPELAVKYAVEIAEDNSHGYSQSNRWGTDYDCSSLVITCYEKAGVPVKTNGATYTGNMLQAFLQSGFKIADYPLEIGDVLLNVQHHTAIYIGDNKIVQATIAETGTVHGQPGDQTGKEIGIYNYYNFPWDYILRYVDTPQEKPQKPLNIEYMYYSLGKDAETEMPILRSTDYGSAVIAMQSALNYHGFLARDKVTGGFGTETEKALKEFQKIHKLEIDGICGAKTWNELMYWR